MRCDLDNQISHSFRFSGVEEFGEVVRGRGWNIEYRQIGKGPFSADLVTRENGRIHLTSARFNNHLHILCEPPARFIGLCLPRFDQGRAAACGRALVEGDLIVFPSLSELEFVTRDEIRNETVLLAEAEFRDAARFLAPSVALFSPRSAAIRHGDPKGLAAIQHEIDSVHRNGGLDSETASNLLARTILWMVDASSGSDAEGLANGVATGIARRAQTWIEEHYAAEIRLEDLCAFAGVGLRTLQRCFASHFQISPTDYIKARRLNAARRALVAANPSDHSVTSIAMDSGFSHLGRFSVDYRMHFGESPRETLRM